MRRALERFARSTVDALSARIAILEGTGTIIGVNRAWRDFASISAASMEKVTEGANYLDVCDAATGEEKGQAEAFAAGIRAVVTGERAEFALEYPCPTPSGEGWFVGRVTRFDDEGEIRIVVAHEEITARKQAEDALRHSEQLLHHIIRNVPGGSINVFDKDLRYLFADGQGLAQIGLSSENLVGKTLSDLFPASAVDYVTPYYRRAFTGEILDFELEVGGHWYIINVAPLEDAEHRINAVIALAQDITGRKQAEEKLRRSRDELEERVDERTRDLARANEVLQAEIVERKRAEEMRKELLRRLVTAQEMERRRIARELHDQMGQHLTALMLGLASLKESCQNQPLAHDRLQQLQRLTSELGQEVHHLAWELRPTALDDWGLQTALSNYVEEWSERCGIPVDFHSTGLDRERLAPEIEATIYRAAQEALNNILRHAEAQRVSLIMERRSDHVVAIVEDDGRGFDTEAVMDKTESKRWLGLLGMKERLALVGGTLQVESTLGAGTTLFMRIPV